jgi:hypothetical protein
MCGKDRDSPIPAKAAALCSATMTGLVRLRFAPLP